MSPWLTCDRGGRDHTPLQVSECSSYFRFLVFVFTNRALCLNPYCVLFWSQSLPHGYVSTPGERLPYFSPSTLLTKPYVPSILYAFFVPSDSDIVLAKQHLITTQKTDTD